jgi:hypothetical protein
MYWFNRIIAETYLDKAAKWIAVRERMWSDDNRLLFLEGEFRRLSEARDRSERGVSAP